MSLYSLKLLVLRAGLLTTSLFYGCFICIRLLFDSLRRGNKFGNFQERLVSPPCLQDPAYGKHSYITLKDVKLHYVENGDPDKPLMLFAHGFPEFWFSWRHQLQYFAKTHWCVAFDMRGYGDSDKPADVSFYHFENLQKDIVELVAALGKKDCILVGHDWGGAAACAVASNFPGVVSKLILLNSPHTTAFRLLIYSSVVQFLMSWYIFVFQLPYLPELYLYNDDLSIFSKILEESLSKEDLEAYKYTFRKKEFWTPPLNYYRNYLNQDLENMASGQIRPLPTIDIPTLIIWGNNDIALHRSIPEKCKPFIANLRIEYIENGSHFIQTHKPEEVNMLIASFVV